MPRIIIAITMILCLVFVIASCGKNNDEIGITNTISAVSTDMIQTTTPDSQPELKNASEFNSNDNSVSYSINISEYEEFENLPIVDVKPHAFTSENAQKIATALFKGAEFFEKSSEASLGKDEIEANIALWSEFKDEAKLRNLFGGSNVEDMQRLLDGFIKKYTEILETAPDAVEKTECQWTFYPYEHYYQGSTNSGTYFIEAETEYNGIPYSFIIVNRDESDYVIHNVYAHILEITSPRNINARILKYELCKGQEPNEEQLKRITTKAMDLLKAFDVGDWCIDECVCSPLEYGEESAYEITVSAVPVFHGAKAVRQLQLDNLTSENNERSNYYYTDAMFKFSPSGDLIEFELFSPVDEVECKTEAADVLSLDTLLDIAKAVLIEDSCKEYYPWNDIQETLTCDVSINTIEYGLTRLRNTDNNSYEYVPAITFKGSFTVKDESGITVYSSEDYSPGKPVAVLVLNAIAGSIIDTQK